MFKTVNIETAFDRKSYFRDIAQNIVPTRYNARPMPRSRPLFSIDHFLNNISAATSRTTASSNNPKNMYFSNMFIHDLFSCDYNSESDELH